VVDGARDELHRMALNLMENAIRHTPPGTRVPRAVARDDGEVVLTVEDDGPGVPPELRDASSSASCRGAAIRGSSSGLGLSNVRAVADPHAARHGSRTPHGSFVCPARRRPPGERARPPVS
jgi:signal transduction histidine kinase